MSKLQLMLQQALVQISACRRKFRLERLTHGALLLPHALSTRLMRLETAPNVLGLERPLDVSRALAKLLPETAELGVDAGREVDQRTQSGEQLRKHRLRPDYHIIPPTRELVEKRSEPGITTPDAELPFIDRLQYTPRARTC